MIFILLWRIEKLLAKCVCYMAESKHLHKNLSILWEQKKKKKKEKKNACHFPPIQYDIQSGYILILQAKCHINIHDTVRRIKHQILMHNKALLLNKQVKYTITSYHSYIFHLKITTTKNYFTLIESIHIWLIKPIWNMKNVC